MTGGPFGFSRVVFLSHVLAAGGPLFPGDPPVEIEVAATVRRDGYFLQRVACGEQAGTHWAAPAHFSLEEVTADQLDPGDFFLPAVVIDIRDQVAVDRDFAVAAKDVECWEDTNGKVPPGAAVLLRTGYDQWWGDPAAYLGTDEAGGLHYPGFGAAAVRWLIERRQIGALGTDAMGVDPGADGSFGSNRLLLRDHRIHLENLRGLGQLPAAGGWIIVGGMRIMGGSGSPATVFGLVP